MKLVYIYIYIYIIIIIIIIITFVVYKNLYRQISSEIISKKGKTILKQ